MVFADSPQEHEIRDYSIIFSFRLRDLFHKFYRLFYCCSYFDKILPEHEIRSIEERSYEHNGCFPSESFAAIFISSESESNSWAK